MNTTIIGLGAIGSTIARNLAHGGTAITLASRTLAEAQKLAKELGTKATASEMAGAIDGADVVILAVGLDAMKAIAAEHGWALAKKIVVDPSNPIAPDGKGGFAKTIPADASSGEMMKASLPTGARLVKAFGTLSAATLASGTNREPERAVLFYASDDVAAGKDVAGLISASGFAPVRIGGIDQSIRIEVGGDLHEMGKLGRLVSASEGELLVEAHPH